MKLQTDKSALVDWSSSDCPIALHWHDPIRIGTVGVHRQNTLPEHIAMTVRVDRPSRPSE